jgi:hypothetical protein
MSSKSQTFITNEQWQRLNYRKLVELAEDPKYAQTIAEFLDDNPEIRNDLTGIYLRARDTLRRIP